ncbi:hypothetical protein [Burkholderia multivorans]|uniref:hypothetical protein n=1 Tax=Burkholderia multivorans TaxID=87883 RepID=UPI001C23A954|nr:hypothetical protein [Burkholderia multivorans]MBU9553867.1 hypothetical protein [Burkholderia multivorans]
MTIKRLNDLRIIIDSVVEVWNYLQLAFAIVIPMTIFIDGDILGLAKLYLGFTSVIIALHFVDHVLFLKQRKLANSM